MSDLISRTALLAEFKESGFLMSTIVRLVIERAPSVEAGSGWIGVNDRLPETDAPVLCWYIGRDGSEAASVGQYYRGYDMWDLEIESNDAGCGVKEVTHWMAFTTPNR